MGWYNVQKKVSLAIFWSSSGINVRGITIRMLLSVVVLIVPVNHHFKNCLKNGIISLEYILYCQHNLITDL